MRTSHVLRSISGSHHQKQEIVLGKPASEYTLPGKQAFANFQSAGTGYLRYYHSVLANFARVFANFAKKTTKSSQKAKADMAILPTPKSEIGLDEPWVN